MAAAQAETRRLRTAATREAGEKASLEQAADELEAKCRAASAAEEDFRLGLELFRLGLVPCSLRLLPRIKGVTGGDRMALSPCCKGGRAADLVELAALSSS